jgi:type II secretory pathway pseudopilin PulG
MMLGAVTADHKKRPPWAFAIVEVIIVAIILVVLAMLVGPQLTVASNANREDDLQAKLLNLRTQVLVYRAEHGGLPPGYPPANHAAPPNGETFVAQLTQYTDKSGNTSPTGDRHFRYGPYLEAMPVNPMNNSSAIRFIADDQLFPQTPRGSEGWVYKPATGTIAANVGGNDLDGTPYFDY